MTPEQLLALARRQHGLVTRHQAAALGFGRSSLARAVAQGWFKRILPTVYLINPAPDSHLMRCHAVQLWMQDEGFVNGRSAGLLHGLMRMGPEYPIVFTIPHRLKRTAPTWVELRRTAWYSAEADRIRLPSGIHVATPERMLFGLAADLRQRRFDGAADDAWHVGLTTPDTVDRYLHEHRCRGKDGVARLEAWLERAQPQQRPSQSYLERDLLEALRAAGLPEPVRQFELELPDRRRPIHIDLAWPEIRLGVEPGHSRFHEGDADFEHDTVRDLACRELGWEIQRLTQGIRRDLTGFACRLRTVHDRRTRDLASTQHRNSGR